MAKHRRPKKLAPSPVGSSRLGRPEQSFGEDRAKHLKRRRPPALLLAGTTAVGLSAALVFGHATDTTVDSSQIELAAAAIGIGGRGDSTAAKIPAKINGDVVPSGYTYVPVNYPASYFIDSSVAAGVPKLHQAILDNAGQDIVVVGYSEGTLVAEEERRALAGSGIDPDTLRFTMIASPNMPNGGIYGRFPHLNLLIISSNGPAQPSQFDTDYDTNEYDPYADFAAYLNPLSLANSLMAVFYVHPDQYYDTIDLTEQPAGPAITKTVNSAGGTDTYVFVLADHLPLFQPIRDVANVLGIAFLTEPVLSGVEPLVRLFVDMGYTDRENLNPEVPTRFRLITPPGRIIETLVKVPDAIAEGANNFANGGTPSTSSTPLTVTPGPANSSSFRDARELPVQQEPQKPQEPQEPVVVKPKDPAPEDSSVSQLPQQSPPPSQTQPKPRSQTPPRWTRVDSPFSISTLADNGPKTSPDSTKPRRFGDGRLINTVKDAVTDAFGGKPKPSAQPDASQSAPASTTSQGDAPAA